MGTEVIPITSNYFGDKLLKWLKYMQRRTIRSIFDALFCRLNEIIESELLFYKIKIFLWIRTLTFQGKLLNQGY